MASTFISMNDYKLFRTEFGYSPFIYIGGDEKLSNPTKPVWKQRYQLVKAVATHSTPNNIIYGVQLMLGNYQCGWIRESSVPYLLYIIEMGFNIEGVVRGALEEFIWHGEECYRGNIHWEVVGHINPPHEADCDNDVKHETGLTDVN